MQSGCCFWQSTSTFILRLYCLDIAKIKFLDESGSNNYCLCTVLVRCRPTLMHSFLVKIYVYTFLVKKIYAARNVNQLLVRTRFFVLTKFSMANDSHMDAHTIYDLTVIHLLKCFFFISSHALLVCYRPRATLIRHLFQERLVQSCSQNARSLCWAIQLLQAFVQISWWFKRCGKKTSPNTLTSLWRTHNW